LDADQHDVLARTAAAIMLWTHVSSSHSVRRLLAPVALLAAGMLAPNCKPATGGTITFTGTITAPAGAGATAPDRVEISLQPLTSTEVLVVLVYR
jgi:type 1 fimbria pilin